MSDPLGADAVLGEAWTSGRARLLQAVPLAGLDDVWSGPDGVVVGKHGGAPQLLEWTEVGLARPAGAVEAVEGAAVSGRVAWLGGAVAANVGRPWVRAWAPDGAARWMVTTPSAVQDLEVWRDQLWVATEAEVLVLDAAGALVRRLPRGAIDLAAAEDGIWAVDGESRLWLSEGVDERGAAADSAFALADGRVASRVVSAAVSGRFGDDGSPRAVVARADGLVVGLDSLGRPAFTLTLPGQARLAAWDPDGDGHDELLVAVENRSLARIELYLP